MNEGCSLVEPEFID